MASVLSAEAQFEIQQGRALPLEDALRRIVDSVDEVLVYTLTAPTGKGARVEFICRVHDDIVMPLAFLSPIPGIVPVEMIKSTVDVLKRHTTNTLIFE
jgi:hypothetical protein